MTGGGISVARAEDDGQFVGHAEIRGPKWLRMPILTIGLLGIQLFWSVEQSYASPYLISLGLSKSRMAVVFLAGPLSGLVVQPLIGVMADSCTSQWGRRRPFVLVGSILCVLGMLLLGWTGDFAGVFTADKKGLTKWLAILSVYVIDYSINAVQAMDRALIVDMLPPSDQASGNAWAARMFGVGSVIGFFSGNLDLPAMFPSLGDTELEDLSVIMSVCLLLCHAITAFSVKERVLVAPKAVVPKKSAIQILKHEVKEIVMNMRNLPPAIQKICMIQFFAWIAWFPVLFYTSLYVGDTHKQTVLTSSDSPDDINLEVLDAEATRLGSRALFYAALVTLVCNIALPFFIASPGVPKRRLIPEIRLVTLWAFSLLLFALCMMATFFTGSVAGATLIMTATGFSWAITQWAPFTLLAEAILTTTKRTGDVIMLEDTRGLGAEEDDDRSDHEEDTLVPSDLEGGAPETEDLSAKAGIILGIHNIYIVIPQLIVTGISAVVFAIFDTSSSIPNNSVVYVFRFGGVAALVAFALCYRLAREL